MKYLKKLSKSYYDNKKLYLTIGIVGGLLYTFISLYLSWLSYLTLQFKLEINYKLIFTFIPLILSFLFQLTLSFMELILGEYNALFLPFVLILFSFLFRPVSIILTFIFGLFLTINLIYLIRRYK